MKHGRQFRGPEMNVKRHQNQHLPPLSSTWVKRSATLLDWLNDIRGTSWRSIDASC